MTAAEGLWVRQPQAPGWAAGLQLTQQLLTTVLTAAPPAPPTLRASAWASMLPRSLPSSCLCPSVPSSVLQTLIFLKPEEPSCQLMTPTDVTMMESTRGLASCRLTAVPQKPGPSYPLMDRSANRTAERGAVAIDKYPGDGCGKSEQKKKFTFRSRI